MKGSPLAPEYKKVGRTVTGTGIQHAKTALVDTMLVIGSVSWTVNSKANSELAALIRLHPAGERSIREVLKCRLAGGERFEAALARPRSRSASRYAETDS